MLFWAHTVHFQKITNFYFLFLIVDIVTTLNALNLKKRVSKYLIPEQVPRISIKYIINKEPETTPETLSVNSYKSESNDECNICNNSAIINNQLF